MIEIELKSFAARAFRVVFDAGRLAAVTPTVRPDRPYLEGLSVALQRDGVSLPMEVGAPVIDADEVEQRWIAEGTAIIDVRHSFVGGWRTRIVVTSACASAWTASLRCTAAPGPGYRPWRLTTGSAAVLAFLPDDPETPILYARSTSSSAPIGTPPDDEAAFEIGPRRFESGDRLVFAWDWEVVSHPRHLAAEVTTVVPGVPRWSTVAVGDEIWLPADLDTALAVPEELVCTDLEDRHALRADDPGRRRVELRSARGSTVLDLGWVTPVPDFLASAAERVLTGPTGPAGVVGLPDLATALVVQHVARTTGFPRAAAAADALDQYTARFDNDGPDPAWRAVYLAGEYDRLGDLDMITRAAGVASRATAATPGLGLALVRTTVAAVLAGRIGATAHPVPPVGEPESAWDLELLFATRPPATLADSPDALAALHRLGVCLYAGLPGRLPPDQSIEVLAHALAVLRMTPDALEPWWRGRFGCSTSELADARALELVDRLGPVPISAAHVWLTLAS